jgi:hypothetical protein
MTLYLIYQSILDVIDYPCRFIWIIIISDLNKLKLQQVELPNKRKKAFRIKQLYSY